RQQVAFFAFAAGIADHAGSAAHERNRPMPRLLKAAEEQDRQKRADVEAVAGRVEAGVEGARSARQPGAEVLGMRALIDKPAPSEAREEVHAGSQGTGDSMR